MHKEYQGVWCNSSKEFLNSKNLKFAILRIFASTLLEYNYDYEFRSRINSEFIRDINNNIITLKSIKFDEYRCGLMDFHGLLSFYGCNQSHHHVINFHKHWSVLQKT